jgi:hypothetical protein
MISKQFYDIYNEDDGYPPDNLIDESKFEHLPKVERPLADHFDWIEKEHERSLGIHYLPFEYEQGRNEFEGFRMSRTAGEDEALALSP